MSNQADRNRECLNFILDHFEANLYVGVNKNFDKRSSVTIKGGRPYEYSPREIGDQMVRYFRNCANNNYPITITALCMNIGMSREGLRKMEKSHNAQLVGMVKKGRDIVEFYYEWSAQIVPNPSFQIFALKNMGWRDKWVVQSTLNAGISDKEKLEMLERVRNFSETI